MKTDDDHRSKPEQGGDQSGLPTRDANGRWLKGHCPNPRPLGVVVQNRAVLTRAPDGYVRAPFL